MKKGIKHRKHKEAAGDWQPKCGQQQFCIHRLSSRGRSHVCSETSAVPHFRDKIHNKMWPTKGVCPKGLEMQTF